MNYINQSLYFKILKTFRYFKLYGIQRTLIKIKSQYHMKKKYKSLPIQGLKEKTKKRVGIVGCGNYSFSNIAYYLQKKRGFVMKYKKPQSITKSNLSIFKDSA